MKIKKKILLPVIAVILMIIYCLCYGFGYVPYFLTKSQKDDIMQEYLATHSHSEKWFYTADIVNVSRKITRPDEVLLSVYLHEDTYKVHGGRLWADAGGEDFLLIHARITEDGIKYLDYESPREGAALTGDIAVMFLPVSPVGGFRLECYTFGLHSMHDDNSRQAEAYYQLPYTGKHLPCKIN